MGGGPGVDPRELDGSALGTVGAAGRDAAWPSVATDSAARLWVNYARAGIAECLSAVASAIQPGTTGHAPITIRTGDGRYEFDGGPDRGRLHRRDADPTDGAVMAAYGATPIDDGGGSNTQLWQQVVATLTDVGLGRRRPPVSLAAMRVSTLFARTLWDDPVGGGGRLSAPAPRRVRPQDRGRDLHHDVSSASARPRRSSGSSGRRWTAMGSQEFWMPIVLPAEPWRATGRYAAYGDPMFRPRTGTVATSCSGPRRRRSWPSSRSRSSHRTGTHWRTCTKWNGSTDEFPSAVRLLRPRVPDEGRTRSTGTRT